MFNKNTQPLTAKQQRNISIGIILALVLALAMTKAGSGVSTYFTNVVLAGAVILAAHTLFAMFSSVHSAIVAKRTAGQIKGTTAQLGFNAGLLILAFVVDYPAILLTTRYLPGNHGATLAVMVVLGLVNIFLLFRIVGCLMRLAADAVALAARKA